MSEEQLSALLAKLKDDADLREKLKGVIDIDAALSIVNEAGFDVSESDLLRRQANAGFKLSERELEDVAGGGTNNVICSHDFRTCNCEHEFTQPPLCCRDTK